jgi:hypothetical protein
MESALATAENHKQKRTRNRWLLSILQSKICPPCSCTGRLGETLLIFQDDAQPALVWFHPAGWDWILCSETDRWQSRTIWPKYLRLIENINSSWRLVPFHCQMMPNYISGQLLLLGKDIITLSTTRLLWTPSKNLSGEHEPAAQDLVIFAHHGHIPSRALLKSFCLIGKTPTETIWSNARVCKTIFVFLFHCVGHHKIVALKDESSVNLIPCQSCWNFWHNLHFFTNSHSCI